MSELIVHSFKRFLSTYAFTVAACFIFYFWVQQARLTSISFAAIAAILLTALLPALLFSWLSCLQLWLSKKNFFLSLLFVCSMFFVSFWGIFSMIMQIVPQNDILTSFVIPKEYNQSQEKTKNVESFFSFWKTMSSGEIIENQNHAKNSEPSDTPKKNLTTTQKISALASEFSLCWLFYWPVQANSFVEEFNKNQEDFFLSSGVFLFLFFSFSLFFTKGKDVIEGFFVGFLFLVALPFLPALTQLWQIIFLVLGALGILVKAKRQRNYV